MANRLQRGHYQGAAARGYDQRWHTFTTRSQAPIIAAANPHLRAATRVLDAGCGTGTLLAALLARQPDLQATGVDGSPAMIDQARTRLGDRADLLLLNLDDPFPAGLAAQRFDLITCANVLHYLRAPGVALHRLAALLAPGGLLIAEDFTRHGWWWPAFELVLHRADPQHQRTLTPAELANLVAATGLSIMDITAAKAGGPWRATSVTSILC